MTATMTEPAWAAQSLDTGAAGTALLHIERARTGQGDWKMAHSWIARATAHDLNGSEAAALFLGAPALAFVLHAAADPPERYQAARDTLDQHVPPSPTSAPAPAWTASPPGSPHASTNTTCCTGSPDSGRCCCAPIRAVQPSNTS